MNDEKTYYVCHYNGKANTVQELNCENFQL